jgi:hypothetical protein
MFHKHNIYQFFHKKLLASLFISKELTPHLLELPGFLNITLTFNTLKTYDINLLTLNALLFLIFGQYPKSIFDKKLAKYRKSKISFKISFSKKNTLYFFLKLYFLCLSRQPEFDGFLYKTMFFIIPPKVYSFSSKSVLIFYLIDYLYTQQPKNLLTVKQKFTLNINCSFLQKSFHNLDYLSLINLPLFFDTEFTESVQNNANESNE